MTSSSVTFGMHVAKGVQVNIAEGGLVIGNNGESPVVLFQTRVSVAWQWFEIALSNLTICREANAEFMEQLRQKAPGKEDDPLWRTVASGMQAAIAVAFALDGIYAEIKQQFPLPAEITSKWKANKTARYTQIAETIGRTFGISGENAKSLRHMLKGIFELRDMAVHPPASFSYPIPFGNSGVNVDKTFAAFHFEDVSGVVRHGIEIMRLMANGKSKDNATRTFAESNLVLMKDAIGTWERFEEAQR